MAGWCRINVGESGKDAAHPKDEGHAIVVGVRLY